MPCLHTSAEPLMREFAQKMLTARWHLHAHSKSSLPLLLNPTHPPTLWFMEEGRHHTRRKHRLAADGMSWWKGKWFQVKFPFYQTISHANLITHSSSYLCSSEPSTTKTAEEHQWCQPRYVSTAGCRRGAEYLPSVTTPRNSVATPPLRCIGFASLLPREVILYSCWYTGKLAKKGNFTRKVTPLFRSQWLSDPSGKRLS